MKPLNSRTPFRFLSAFFIVSIASSLWAPSIAVGIEQRKTSDPHAFDASEDRRVNEAVISAVRKGNSLQIESTRHYNTSYFQAIPPLGSAFRKTLTPRQEFVLYSAQGFVRYKVMAFEKAGLKVRFYRCSTINSFGASKPSIQSGSFIIRFKSAPRPI